MNMKGVLDTPRKLIDYSNNRDMGLFLHNELPLLNRTYLFSLFPILNKENLECPQNNERTLLINNKCYTTNPTTRQ